MEKWIKDAHALHIPPKIIEQVIQGKRLGRAVRIKRWTLRWTFYRDEVTLFNNAYIIHGFEKDIPHLLYVACTDPGMFQSTKRRHYGCPEVYLPVRRKERIRT